ncbi:MAG: hypothetical protein WCG32_05895 [Actinomycetes bacterium]
MDEQTSLQSDTTETTTFETTTSSETTTISGGAVSGGDDHTSVPSKSGDFDTLVLSGGSVQAMIMLGALQYAEDNFLLKKINSILFYYRKNLQ